MEPDQHKGNNATAPSEVAFQRIFRLAHTLWDVLGDAIHTFGDRHASQAAAGMAYYAVFSLFPLLIFLINLGTLFVTVEEAQRQIYESITRVLPISQDVVIQNLQQVMANRRTAEVIAAISLLWSGLGFFAVLASNIDRAWHETQPRTYIQGRLVALAMVIGLAMLLSITVAGNTFLHFMPSLSLALFGGELNWVPTTKALLSQLVPLTLSFLLFLVLYHQVPNAPVGWSESVWSAVIIAIIWRLATVGFVWYVSARLVKYRLVYGSLGSLIVLMFWIYISSWIALFGAHLCAAIGRYNRTSRFRNSHR